MTTARPDLPALSRNAWTPCWENLNKVEWTHGFVFECHGVHLGVRVNNPDLLVELRKRLPPGAERSEAKTVARYFSVILGGQPEGSRIRFYNLLYIDHTRMVRSFELDDVFNAFETWVRLSVGELTRERIFIHAGVVGWNNCAILIPGKTFTGKTSLVLELVKAGATYYSDEFAVIDAQGRVHPFSTPLGVRENGSDRQRTVPVEEIGGWAGSKPLPIGLVVMSEYETGAQWRPRRMSPGRAALALLANTISARRWPERSLALLERIVSQAPALKGTRGEAAAAAQDIFAALAREAPDGAQRVPEPSAQRNGKRLSSRVGIPSRAERLVPAS